MTELEKANVDLENAVKLQELMKSANAVIRKNKNVTEELVKLGLTNDQARELQEPDFANRTGFPAYKLTNNNATIKRIQDKVNMLKKKQVASEKAVETGGHTYTFDGGGEIVVNYAEDRVQILFPGGRVEKDIYSKLRKNGWVYSPTNKAFQRKLTPQAISDAVSMFNAKRTENTIIDKTSDNEPVNYNEMLDSRNFSYVSGNIYNAISKDYKGDNTFNLVYFDLVQSDIVQKIKDYFKQHLPEIESDKIVVNVYPKTYIKEAKALFDNGKYLPSNVPVKKLLGALYTGVKDFFATSSQPDLFSQELQKGIKVEQEHKGTLEKLYTGETTVNEAVVEIAKDHIKEDPKYYEKLEEVEKSGTGKTSVRKYKDSTHGDSYDFVRGVQTYSYEVTLPNGSKKYVNAVDKEEAIKMITEPVVVQDVVVEEPNTPDEFDQAVMDNIVPQENWVGNIVKEGNIRRQILEQLSGPEEDKLIEAQRIFSKYKAMQSEGEIFYTSAPESYDGFGTKTLEITEYKDRSGNPVRKVLVTQKNIGWQTNRYISGNFGFFDEVYFNAAKSSIFTKVEPEIPEFDITDEVIDYSSVSTKELKELHEKTNDFSKLNAITKELNSRIDTKSKYIAWKQREIWDNSNDMVIRQAADKLPDETIVNYQDIVNATEAILKSGKETDKKVANAWAEQLVLSVQWLDPEFKDWKNYSKSEKERLFQEYKEFGIKIPDNVNLETSRSAPKYAVNDYVKYTSGDVDIETWYGQIERVVDLDNEYAYRVNAYHRYADGKIGFDSEKTNEKYEVSLSPARGEMFILLKSEYDKQQEEKEVKSYTDEELKKKLTILKIPSSTAVFGVETKKRLIGLLQAEIDSRADYNSKTVDELVALKKEKYPNPDIESAMSADEKLLNKIIAQKYSELNEQVRLKRKKETPVIKMTPNSLTDELVYDNAMETKDIVDRHLSRLYAERDFFVKTDAPSRVAEIDKDIIDFQEKGKQLHEIIKEFKPKTELSVVETEKDPTREEFFELPSATSVEQLEDNINTILSQYSHRKMAATQVLEYLNESGELGKEWLKSKNILTKTALDSYLAAQQSKLRAGKGKERKEIIDSIKKQKEETFIDNITSMAHEAEAKIQQQIVEHDDNEIMVRYPRLTKQQVRNVYEQVNAILQNSENINAQNRYILEQYEGLGSQTQTGIIDKGLLHQFYTPYIIAKKSYDLATHYGFKGGVIIEPSMGTGRFFKYAPSNSTLIGFDPDGKNVEIARLLYPDATIYQQEFETAFLESPRYNKKASKSWIPEADLVIGNPPYGDYLGYYKSYMPKEFKRFEFLFVYLGLKLLKKDGLLIFIVSQNFMNNGAMYNGMKAKILEIGTFVDSIRLPNGIFSSTDVGTDIIIFKRK